MAFTCAMTDTQVLEFSGREDNNCMVTQLFTVASQLSTEVQELRQELKALNDEDKTVHEELAKVIAVAIGTVT
jgi:NTP pyrophosphatase (non-canonical NTP hydrolase)